MAAPETAEYRDALSAFAQAVAHRESTLETLAETTAQLDAAQGRVNQLIRQRGADLARSDEAALDQGLLESALWSAGGMGSHLTRLFEASGQERWRLIYEAMVAQGFQDAEIPGQALRAAEEEARASESEGSASSSRAKGKGKASGKGKQRDNR